jgi:hypothetical protein
MWRAHQSASAPPPGLPVGHGPLATGREGVGWRWPRPNHASTPRSTGQRLREAGATALRPGQGGGCLSQRPAADVTRSEGASPRPSRQGARACPGADDATAAAELEAATARGCSSCCLADRKQRRSGWPAAASASVAHRPPSAPGWVLLHRTIRPFIGHCGRAGQAAGLLTELVGRGGDFARSRCRGTLRLAWRTDRLVFGTDLMAKG